MSKVMIVGDIHGDWPKLNRLIAKKHPDIILQCGDFGWWPRFNLTRNTIYTHKKPWNTDQLKPQVSKIYWCDGNHEEHETLIQDGIIRFMSNGSIFCSRGSTVVLHDGRRVLFMGGAASVDAEYRTPGHDWFPGETIKNIDVERAITFNDGLNIDIVISHTCPLEFDMKSEHKMKLEDPSRKALSLILDHFKPDEWYFGHWHQSKSGVYNGTKWTCLDYPGHGGVWWRWL